MLFLCLSKANPKVTMNLFNNKKRFAKRALLSVIATSFFAVNGFATTSEDYEKALTSFNKSEYDEAYIHLKNSLQKTLKI